MAIYKTLPMSWESTLVVCLICGGQWLEIEERGTRDPLTGPSCPYCGGHPLKALMNGPLMDRPLR